MRMNSKIRIDGEWHECGFLYPFKEQLKPIKVPGPLGASQWQQSVYNAKLVSNRIIPSGNYDIRHKGKQLIFEAERPVIDGIFGNVI
jgi:hypothetical protein